MIPFRSKPENAILDPDAFAPLQDGWEYTAIPILDASETLSDGVTPICFQPTMATGLAALKRLELEPLTPDDVEFLHAEAVAGRCIELPAFTGTPIAETSLEHRCKSDEANRAAMKRMGWKPGMRLCNFGKLVVDGEGRPIDGMWLMGWWVPELALYTPPKGTPGHRSGPGYIQPRPTPGRARHGLHDQADDGSNLKGKRRVVAPRRPSWLRLAFAPVLSIAGAAAELLGGHVLAPSAAHAPGGHVLPAKPETHEGIDVSGHQGAIDWERVAKTDVEFVYVKATEGKSFRDKWAAVHARGALDEGLELGAYHYLRVRTGAQDAAEQALEFLEVHRELGCNLRPALDVETEGNGGRTFAEYLAAIRAFVAVIEAELGEAPLLYTYPGFWAGSTLLRGAQDCARLPLWIAHYSTRGPTIPAPWTKATVWQYAAGAGVIGKVDGVTGAVDRNRLYGSLDLLRL